jgi:hypothetical protein
MATIATPKLRWRYDRLFYTGIGLFIAALTFWGFYRSYYLNRWIATPEGMRELTPLLHIHGAVFTAWILFLVTQPLLIAQKKRKLHRRFGYAGAGIAALVVLTGMVTAIEAMNVGFAGLGDPHSFFAIPFFGVISFAVAVSLAIWWRNHAETHKRLILLANVGIIGAAIARLPVDAVQAAAPMSFHFGPNIIIVAGMLYDIASRGRIHKVWLIGGAAMVALQIIMIPLMTSEPWIAFAKAVAAMW